jgi:CRP-like cAMP-binding protein
MRTSPLRSRRAAADLSLLAVAPFDRYPERAVRPLSAHADRLRLREGTELVREQQRADEFVVVLSGEVIAYCDGQEVGRLGTGAHIGATELLQGTRHAHTLLAGCDLDVLVVYGPSFRWAAQTLPGFAEAVLAGVAAPVPAVSSSGGSCIELAAR